MNGQEPFGYIRLSRILKRISFGWIAVFLVLSSVPYIPSVWSKGKQSCWSGTLAEQRSHHCLPFCRRQWAQQTSQIFALSLFSEALLPPDAQALRSMFLVVYAACPWSYCLLATVLANWNAVITHLPLTCLALYFSFISYCMHELLLSDTCRITPHLNI